MAKANEDRDRFKLTTPEFRASYVNLAKPRAVNPGDDPQYGMNIVLPKDDPFWKKVDTLIDQAAKAKWGQRPKKLTLTRKDGDSDDTPEEWEGCFSVPATSKSRVGVIGLDGEDIVDGSKLYSGAWYRATVRIGAWTYGRMKKGVSVYLENVLFVKDDEPFSGRAKARDDFANFITEGGGDGGDDDDDPLS